MDAENTKKTPQGSASVQPATQRATPKKPTTSTPVKQTKLAPPPSKKPSKRDKDQGEVDSSTVTSGVSIPVSDPEKAHEALAGPDLEPMQEDQTGSNSGKLHVSLAGPNLTQRMMNSTQQPTSKLNLTPKADDQELKETKESEACFQTHQLSSTGWQITDTREAGVDSSMHRSDPESEHSEQSSDDISMQDEGNVSDMEDTDNAHIPKDTYPILLSFTHCGNKSILRVLRIILVMLPEHPSETIVFHNEDGNPARANIKQALGYLKDGDGDGNSQFLRCQVNKNDLLSLHPLMLAWVPILVDSDSPDKMSSPEHISSLPSISPFLCTNSSEAPEPSDGPPSQDP
ncbi:hypothetical protein Tco_1043110 [Tanacetum coccineum]|uniref:Uncharacterized protein n=1 Tax=Tanacetum coccineum TaxID=301880 RepID=A0ABQ5GL41_9ASTR